MQRSEIQRRFTTTIPKEIRKKLGLKEGMELFWDIEGDRVVIYPKSYAPLKGIFKGKVQYSRKVKEEAEEAFLKEIA